jgi:DNA-binding response OmpR family regulator
MRLLLVEDDETIAGFVEKGLTESGFVVDVATNGNRGFEMATSNPYDAAIVDVMLPELDGLTLIDRVRARGVRTPVLILSARR